MEVSQTLQPTAKRLILNVNGLFGWFPAKAESNIMRMVARVVDAKHKVTAEGMSAPKRGAVVKDILESAINIIENAPGTQNLNSTTRALHVLREALIEIKHFFPSLLLVGIAAFAGAFAFFKSQESA